MALLDQLLQQLFGGAGAAGAGNASMSQLVNQPGGILAAAQGAVPPGVAPSGPPAPNPSMWGATGMGTQGLLGAGGKMLEAASKPGASLGTAIGQGIGGGLAGIQSGSELQNQAAKTALAGAATQNEAAQTAQRKQLTDLTAKGQAGFEQMSQQPEAFAGVLERIQALLGRLEGGGMPSAGVSGGPTPMVPGAPRVPGPMVR